MTKAPVLDILLVVLEFVALFLATWIAWFAVITVYQLLTRRTKSRHSEAEPASGPPTPFDARRGEMA